MKSPTPSVFIFLRRHPMLRVLIPLITGIVFEYKFPFTLNAIIYFLSITFSLIIAAVSMKAKNKFRYKSFTGWIAFFLLIGLGALVLYLKTSINQQSHYLQFPAEKYIVCIDDAHVEKNKSIKITARIIAVMSNQHLLKSEGKLMIYLQKDSDALKLNYGDKLAIEGKPILIEAPFNSGEFNYQKYLAFHQVYAQIYLRKNNWLKLKGNYGNNILAFSYDLRQRLISLLRNKMSTSREFAVASALTLGDVSEIDADLMQAFSSSGTLHVLSVSGMHVGVVYLLLTTIFGFAERIKLLRNIYFPFIISSIWGYAILTGCSPSVLRSAAMLSLVIFGKWLRTKSPILNTLAASMFLLLCYDPYFLFDVGFQLSYLAVVGIVVLHPMIVKLIVLQNNYLHKIWELTSVSIAAQLVTFPITLYYFHQFPNYFILANLIIIPLTTIAIYLSIFVIVFAKVAFLGTCVAYPDIQLIKFVDAFVFWIDQLPGAVTSGISITVFECVFLYFALMSVITWMNLKNFNSLFISLLFLIVISVSQLNELYEQRNQNTIISYKIQNHLAYGWIKGRNHLLIGDSTIVSDLTLQKRYLKNLWSEKGLSDPSIKLIYK